jgi:hypothetical protein
MGSSLTSRRFREIDNTSLLHTQTARPAALLPDLDHTVHILRLMLTYTHDPRLSLLGQFGLSPFSGSAPVRHEIEEVPVL